MSGQIGSPILTPWWVCFHGFPYSFLWKPLRNTKCLCPVLTGLICQNKNLVTVLTKNLYRCASKPFRVNPYLKNSPPLVTRVLMTWLWFTANVSTAGLLLTNYLLQIKLLNGFLCWDDLKMSFIWVISKDKSLDVKGRTISAMCMGLIMIVITVSSLEVERLFAALRDSDNNIHFVLHEVNESRTEWLI